MKSTNPDHFGSTRVSRRLLILSLIGGAILLCGWSWPEAEEKAPPADLFASRGSATCEFGAEFAAPGAPQEWLEHYGVIHYREPEPADRDFDLYFSPSLAIWKFHRVDSSDQKAQYVGGFHYSECPGGQVTAMDRVIQPAIGLHPNYGTEIGMTNTMVRTNYGCGTSFYSQPWPCDNYQGAGSGRGILPDIESAPAWDEATQTLRAAAVLVPWIFYEGILDPESNAFLNDFAVTYPMETALRIQQQIAAALDNVRMEIAIRIYPDGTIMLAHLFSDLQGRPWIPYATDGHWIAFDSAPNGRVFYTSAGGQFVEPFAGGANPAGLNLYGWEMGGWAGYFVDTVQPDIGIAFYIGHTTHGSSSMSIFPSYNYPNAPAVMATNRWTLIEPFGKVFRQHFLKVGTKEEMNEMAAVLNPHVQVCSIAPTPPPPETISRTWPAYH
ncbi:MAG TPA: hypothetical protein PLD73_15340 [Candidatus Hydrogenedentes bacterium]|nr:hypothetical protein [Candidatus Hydrogenedentota bacterium]